MVCKELLLEVEKLYPEANSITSALQMHLVKTIKADQVVSQGNNKPALAENHRNKNEMIKDGNIRAHNYVNSNVRVASKKTS
jgi:hypothetical protein